MTKITDDLVIATHHIELKAAFWAVVLLMCLAGLFVKSPSEEQLPLWDVEDESVVFRGGLSAYTERLPGSFGITDTLSLEIFFQPSFQQKKRFSTILEIVDTADNSRIAVSQWKNQLIVLNNGDFKNTRKSPKIYCSMDPKRGIYWLSIKSNSLGTKAYLNDKLCSENNNFVLSPPKHPDASHLILGNGIRGHSPWLGAIDSIRVESISNLNQSLNANIYYDFSKGESDNISDLVSGIPLILAKKPILLSRQVFVIPHWSRFNEPWFWKDALVNLIGFIPFGFLFFLISKGTSFTKSISGIWFVTIGALVFSFCIEVTQIVLPMRTSSIMDLLLNTIGGWMGASIAKIWCQKKHMLN